MSAAAMVKKSFTPVPLGKTSVYVPRRSIISCAQGAISPVSLLRQAPRTAPARQTSPTGQSMMPTPPPRSLTAQNSAWLRVAQVAASSDAARRPLTGSYGNLGDSTVPRLMLPGCPDRVVGERGEGNCRSWVHLRVVVLVSATSLELLVAAHLIVWRFASCCL